MLQCKIGLATRPCFTIGFSMNRENGEAVFSGTFSLCYVAVLTCQVLNLNMSQSLGSFCTSCRLPCLVDTMQS
jgi:hypothetical protein